MSMLDLKRIEAAIAQIGTEKKISREKLVDIIEAAIKTAYKKDFGSKDSEVNVKIDFAANTVELAIDKEVVEVVEDPETQIALSDLGDDADGFEIGDVIEIDVTEEFMASDGFGRIASQAARQVIIQKIQETEKEKIYNLFRDKE
jgi:transcription termination/antitermination protein NusA